MSDWEKSLLGTVLSDPRSYEAAADLIPSDFTGPNQIIWAELMPLASRGVLDARALSNALRQSHDRDRLEQLSGGIEAYIAECYQMRGTQAAEYANRVLEASIKRGLKKNAALIAAEADGDQKTADELLDYAEDKILAMRRTRIEGGMTMGDLFGMYIPRLEDMRSGRIQPAWQPNIDGIRHTLTYAEPADYMIIGSRPGGGKSSILKAEALKTAQGGQHVTVFNLENDNAEYARTWISMATGIDNELLKSPRRLTPDQLASVKDWAERLARLPIRLVNAAGWSANQILRVARKSLTEDKMALMQVDYLQLVSNGKDKKHEDIEHTSQQLRAFTLRHGVPQLDAAQINRDVDTRAGDEVEVYLNDLKGSGSLEQDASVIFFPLPGWKKTPGPTQLRQFPENQRRARDGRTVWEATCVPIRIHLAKNRNGSTSISDWVKWNRATNAFQMLPQDWNP